MCNGEGPAGTLQVFQYGFDWAYVSSRISTMAPGHRRGAPQSSARSPIQIAQNAGWELAVYPTSVSDGLYFIDFMNSWETTGTTVSRPLQIA